MTKQHLILYDILLPSCFIAAIGFGLDNLFGESVFLSLLNVESFGFGAWFSVSDVRPLIWNSGWVFFALLPSAAWLIWVCINLEYDWVYQCRRLDRPLFTFIQGFFQWMEGGDTLAKQRFGYEGQLAIAQNRYCQLDARFEELQQILDRSENEKVILQRELSMVVKERDYLQATLRFMTPEQHPESMF